MLDQPRTNRQTRAPIGISENVEKPRKAILEPRTLVSALYLHFAGLYCVDLHSIGATCAWLEKSG